MDTDRTIHQTEDGGFAFRARFAKVKRNPAEFWVEQGDGEFPWIVRYGFEEIMPFVSRERAEEWARAWEKDDSRARLDAEQTDYDDWIGELK